MAKRAEGLNDIYDNDLEVKGTFKTNKGLINKTPVNNLDIVNKKYVDDNIHFSVDDTNENTYGGTGTTNGDAGTENTFIGYHAGYNNSTDNTGGGDNDGEDNVYIGHKAGAGETAGSKNEGGECVAIGSKALRKQTTGYENTAIGDDALQYLTTGYANIAIGNDAMQGRSGNAITGHHNTAIGTDCMNDVTSGDYNTAIGYAAMKDITIQESNIAIGRQAGENIAYSTGNDGNANAYIGYRAGFGSSGSNYGENNIGIGYATLFANTHGNYNCAIGYGALQYNTGYTHYNLAIGFKSLNRNSSGSQNCGIGFKTLEKNQTSDTNTAIGYYAGGNLTAGGCVFIGANAGKNQTTTGNLLIIDNRDRGSAANEASQALLYGLFSNTISSQYLKINGSCFITQLKSGSTAANAGAGTNELWITSSHASLPDNVVMIG